MDAVSQGRYKCSGFTVLFYKRLCVIFILSAASVFHVASVANTGEGVTSCPDGSQLSIIDKRRRNQNTHIKQRETLDVKTAKSA